MTYGLFQTSCSATVFIEPAPDGDDIEFEMRYSLLRVE